MKTIDTQVSKLSGPALDWVVAHAMNLETNYRLEARKFVVEIALPHTKGSRKWQDWNPTTSPAQVVQIMQDLRVSVEPVGDQWVARSSGLTDMAYGPAAAVDESLLVAVCRVIAISGGGHDEWPVPEDLLIGWLP